MSDLYKQFVNAGRKAQSLTTSVARPERANFADLETAISKIVEAYPLRTEITKLLPYERYMGIQSTFERLGFEVHDVEGWREHFQKKAEKRVKRFQKELTRSKVLKRAESFREDVSKQIEKQMEQSLETLLGSLQIASRSEVKKLDQKLNRINRRLRALDKVIEEVEE